MYSSFPFFAAYIVAVVSSFGADIIISRQIMSIKNCRIFFNSLGTNQKYLPKKRY